MNRSLLIAALLTVGLVACGEKPAPAPAPTPAPAPAAAPAPAPAPTPPPKPTTAYSAADCKVLTADDIASVLGVTAAAVTELPVQKSPGVCIESFTVKIGATPTPVSVSLTETKITPLMMTEPKICLANTKKMVAADKPNLGIGDYDSFEMIGGAIIFGKGIYMVQVTCPMGISIDKTTALAKLVAKHI